MCEKKKAIDLCLALDNSGSICSEGTPQLCNNCNKDQECSAGGEVVANGSCCGNYAGLEDFAKEYIASLSGDGTVSVVKYGSVASTIAQQGTPGAAIKAIESSSYTGGFTNTEMAIDKCIEQLKGTPNPMIVLVTDGTPTACRKKGTTNKYVHIYKEGCSDVECNACEHGPPKDAAETMADMAQDLEMHLIPVVISGVSEDSLYLEKLARCPSGDPVAYMNLHVDRPDEISAILNDLIKVTGCDLDAVSKVDGSDTSTGGSDASGSDSGGSDTSGSDTGGSDATPTPSPCCSSNYKNCNKSNLSYGDCMKKNFVWLPNGALSNCQKRYKGCGNDRNGCCDGLTCQWRDNPNGNDYFACLPEADDDSGSGSNSGSNSGSGSGSGSND